MFESKYSFKRGKYFVTMKSGKGTAHSIRTDTFDFTYDRAGEVLYSSYKLPGDVLAAIARYAVKEEKEWLRGERGG